MGEVFSWPSFLDKYRVPLVVGLVGFLFVGVGILVILFSSGGGDSIEIISETSSASSLSETLFADIEGSVEKPGVYKLSFGSRVEDLLIAAGGLSPSADRDWVSKSINRAQKLVDGAKIYIPEKGNTSSLSGTGGQGVSPGGVAGVTAKINVNTASESVLDTLWGVGPATAQKIISGRPYGQVEELKTKKILNQNVFDRIKDQVTVF